MTPRAWAALAVLLIIMALIAINAGLPSETELMQLPN